MSLIKALVAGKGLHHTEWDIADVAIKLYAHLRK